MTLWTKMTTTMAVAACTLFASSALAEVDKLRIIGTLPVGHHMSDALNVFKEEVEAGSEITVDVFPAGQLYGDADSVKVLPSGSIDLGIVQLDFWMGLVPAGGILYLPTYYDSVEHYYAIRDAVTPVLAKELEEKGKVKLLGWADYDAEAMISKKEIKSLEDFKGTKLRGYGQYSAAFLQAVGSSPVVMSSAEAYDALSKGVIDGTLSGPTSHLSRKFYEVADNLVVQPEFIQPAFSYAILMNLAKWNELSDEQKSVVEAAAKTVQTYTAEEFPKATAAATEKLKEHGINVVEVASEEFERIKAIARPALEEKFIRDAGEEIAKPMIEKANELRTQ